MPRLPVACPACAADLTVAREHLNRPARCAACGRPFVPVADPGGPEPDDEPVPPPPPPRPVEVDGVREDPGSMLGLLSFFLGLIALLFCCWGPVSFLAGGGAVVTGLLGRRTPDSRRLAAAGLALGLFAVALRAVAVLAGVNGDTSF
ncbi:hypothetical protein J0H58_27380 [bacterium]|nr:hypothetical protein [bacterium]